MVDEVEAILGTDAAHVLGVVARRAIRSTAPGSAT